MQAHVNRTKSEFMDFVYPNLLPQPISVMKGL